MDKKSVEAFLDSGQRICPECGKNGSIFIKTSFLKGKTELFCQNCSKNFSVQYQVESVVDEKGKIFSVESEDY